MTDEETRDESAPIAEDEKKLEDEIKKEVSKLKYFLEEADELIESKDYVELDILNKRADKIINKLSDIIAQAEELKLDHGTTPRAVRQWKKDVRSTYLSLVRENERLSREIKGREDDLVRESERRQYELEERRQEQHERRMAEQRERQEEHDRRLWEEKIEAELRMTERKLEMEKSAKETTAKLPKLKITPFKGTCTDWVRFENMFLTQVHEKPISVEEKFGYLLEMVNSKVREKIANLKPSENGYKIAWERLKKEYGQSKLVVNAHMDEIINLTPVKGQNYEKVQEFYEKLSKNYDAIQTLGEGDKLQGFVMTTINKLPQVKPDLVRSDDDWEEWSMEKLIDNLQKWLRRNKVEESVKSGKRIEKNYYEREARKSHCVFCDSDDHWTDKCKTVVRLEDRKKFFAEKRLCFNCGRVGHQGKQCRSRGCRKCNAKHHTSLCDKKEGDKDNDKTSLTGFTTFSEEKSLPAIVPVNINGHTLWAYLDTGSGRNFISREAEKKLKLCPTRHEFREMVTVNGTSRQSMPIFQTTIESLDGKVHEEIELTGSRLQDFTTVRRPDMNELKKKYTHTQDKRFYMVPSGEYPIHLILGDGTYSKIRTEKVYKGNSGDPIVEETTFGWVIHGGDDYSSDGACMFSREVNDYERLYSLDVLGVEDRGENDQMDVLTEFRESITRQENGRYEVAVPWIPGSKLSATNEQPSRRRLSNVNKKLGKDESLKREYEKIIEEQLASGVIERAPEKPTGERVYYMPHKPVVRQDATTTKVRMVFDASAKPHPLACSINECMFTGPPLQPLLWDIMVRARMSLDLLLADIQKAFLQIGVKDEDRDAFRFLFDINGKEEHFRFARVPFGVEASPFMLGATLGYHYDQQPPEYEDTVTTLKENTYVDNIMKTGSEIEDLQKFKRESDVILASANFPVHKWESNIQSLEDTNMPNPSKILGHIWDKREDTLEIQAPAAAEDQLVTKRTILSQLGKVYDPLGIISPTMAEGKHIYREACEEKNGWNGEVSSSLRKQWFKWNKQLKNVKVPRSITSNTSKMKAVDLHVFADASNLACSAATIAVVEHQTGTVKGLLTSKSRISKRNTSIARLELVGAHMAANMIKNLHKALHRLPIKSTVVWLDSMVALYWVTNPGKPWKVFISNRVKKIAEITSEFGIVWKYCPSAQNLADLGSRGVNIEKMEKENWFTGPDWLLEKEQWPDQPDLKVTAAVNEESKPIKEESLFTTDRKPDEWEELLMRKDYWRVLRVTAWALRFARNCLARRHRNKKTSGPLTTEEITAARNSWVRKVQKQVNPELRAPGWTIVEDKEMKVLRCKGRITGYAPIYLDDELFVEKLIAHTHNKIKHFGIANTMATLREQWWIPQLRSKVKKVIKNCNVCKLYATKAYGSPLTSNMPTFRTETSKPFEVTGVDYAGPLRYKIKKQEEGKCYILIFTCATSRAVHLELTKSQEAEEFQRKFNAFIARRGRPKLMISDNAKTFKSTANWINVVRKSEKLQDFLASQEIHWRFNLAKSPWWGGIYERLIREIKKALYKTLGRSHLYFENLEMVIIDIEVNMNNRPLTYVESEIGEEQVLTPNILIRGENTYTIEDVENDDDALTKLQKRVVKAKDNAWKRWQREYVHGLMESQRINGKPAKAPEIGEIVLVVGDEKNRGEWKKGKVIRQVRGKDGVVRGVILLHKGHTIERPLQLVCPLEIRCTTQVEERKNEQNKPTEERERRQAAIEAGKRIQALAEDED